jgi:integrase
MKKQSIRIPGTGRIYKRGAVWYLDYWVDGRRKQERGSGSKEEALRILAAKRTDIERGTLRFEKKQIVHFSDFAQIYLEAKAEAQTSSIRSIRGYVNHLVNYFGETPISKITPELVEAYRDLRINQRISGTEPAELRAKLSAAVAALAKTRIAKKKSPCRIAALEERIAGLNEQILGNGRKMKGRSVNRELATLRNIFSVARKKKVFRGDNPVEEVDFFPEPFRNHHILSADEYGRLVEAADSRLRPIIQVAVRTGLRKDDILRLEWKNIDVERGALRAYVSKTETWHEQPILDSLANILESIPKLGEYVFTNPKTGTRWKDIAKWWNEAREAAGLGDLDFTFHDLRANAGTRTAEKAGLFAAQMLLDHKNGATTARYLNKTLETGSAAAKALEDFYSEDRGGEAEVQVTGTKVGQGKQQELLSIEKSIN